MSKRRHCRPKTYHRNKSCKYDSPRPISVHPQAESQPRIEHVKAPCRNKMRASRTTPKDIDEYIIGFPTDVRSILQKMRITIRKAAPDAEETISYQIPAFMLQGKLVYFAAYKKHIGFYPRTTAIAKFKQELVAYEGAKGSVKFPLDKPIPFDLISKIVKFRVKENVKRAAAKRKER